MTDPLDARLQCRYHPACPGCSLLPLPYREQLATKRARLVRALGRYPHLELPEPERIVPAVRTEAYRHRLKLPVDVGRDRVRIGLYDGDHRVLDTPGCPVLAQELRDALPPILDWLRGKDAVHSLDLRVSAANGELLAVFACRGGDLPGGARAARDLRRRIPKLASVAVSSADPEGKRVMGRAPAVLAGGRWIEERIGETAYRLHPGAFFQVDPAQAERIHAVVAEMVGDARTVLDLYAGVGAYGLMLAKGRDRVLLVEEVETAAEGAAAMAPPNVEVVRASVEDLDLRERFEAAIVNPARRGSDPGTLKRLADTVGRLIYVSCGPETLARDLDALAAFGLRARRVVPVDLFPQTPEVETVVLLERGPALDRWRVGKGSVRGPWTGSHSGATGRPREITALLIGDVRPRGDLDGARFERLGTVAGHSLVKIEVKGTPSRPLATLRAWGHPVAGQDPRTARFFAEKAGLLRPFLHVSRDVEGTVAPLHGDLAQAIDALGGVGPATRGKKRRSRR